jgi:hypothetical protein
MSGLRYSDLAVGTISGACVEPEDPGSSSSSTTDDDASGSVGEPIGCDAVDCGGGECVLIDDEATCACGPGLHAVAGPTCVSDPCASARCFYVDAEAPEGGDGSLEAPWSTLDSVELEFPAVQQPGDHVLLRRGSRWADSLLLDDIVGTEDAPIVLGAYGDDPAAPVLAQVRVFNSTFVTVRDLEIDGTGVEGQSGIRAQFVDHLIVRDNYVHDVLSEGIGMHYGAEHTVIINNRVERVSPAETSPDPGLIWVADDWWNENSTDIGDHHYIVDNVLVGLPPMDEEATDRGIVLSNRDGVGDFKVLGNRVTGVVRQGLWFQGRGYGWILHNTLGGIDGASFMPPSGGGWWGAMIVSHESKVRVRGNQVFSAALPFLIGAGGGRGEFEIEGNTFAGGAEGWSLWLGDASGRIENNLVVPDPNAAVHTTDTLERLEGLSLANNVYASESCSTGVFGEDPMDFEQWQEMGYDEGSVCAPVPGVSSVTNFPDDPANWGALEGLVPAASWEGCDAPAGAFDCDGQPTQGGLQTWPSMPDNGGRGWEGPALVRARYPIE